jgi:hypothetical protein
MRRWAQIAEDAFLEEPTVDHIAAALLERAYQPAEEPARQPVVDTLNGVLSNSAGLHGWLSRRRARDAAEGA